MIACAAAAAGCREQAAAARATPSSAKNSTSSNVEVRTVRAEVLPIRIPIVGTLNPGEEVLVSTKTSGILKRTFVEVGAAIDPGSPLGQVDPFDYEAEAAQARAALAEVYARLGVKEAPDASFDLQTISSVKRAAAQVENARFTHQRLVSMGDAASEQELSDVGARVRVAEAEYQLALDEGAALVATAQDRAARVQLTQRRLDQTRTHAPAVPTTLGVPGDPQWYVAERLVTEGQYVAVAQPLYKLIINSPLKLRCRVPERYSAEVRLGQTLEMKTAEGVADVRGTITRIAPDIELATRTFEVEAQVENSDNVIKPGAFVTGIINAQSGRPAIYVPHDAVLTAGGTTRVVIVENGVARRRDVRVGGHSEDRIEVVAGLEDGAQVVVRGAGSLMDGSAVATREENSPADSAVRGG
jgi:RND family efflux transporter MFP subunit